MMAMPVLFVMGLGDLDPNIFSASHRQILIDGSTKAPSQSSIFFHKLAASGHSINACIMVSEGISCDFHISSSCHTFSTNQHKEKELRKELETINKPLINAYNNI